jgi:hypothetical protein
LGWLLERSGSIWAPSLGHASLNAVGGSLTLFLYPDLAQRLYTGVLGLLGWVPLAILCVALTLGNDRLGGRDRQA